MCQLIKILRIIRMASTAEQTEDLRTRLERTVGSSNAILSDAEQKMARILLDEARAHLSTDDREIVKKIDCLQVALAPHKILPPEILVEIFIKYKNITRLCIPLGRPHKGPWILGKICSRWRAVAHAEPRLWNCIIIAEPSPHKQNLEIFQYLVTLMGNLPIDISFLNDPWNLEFMFDILAGYSHRIRSLRFIVHQLITTQHAIVSYPFNILESVKMIILDAEGVPGHISLIPTISAIKNLRVLEIRAHDSMSSAFSLDSTGFNSTLLPSSALTHLTVGTDITMSASLLLNTFSHCTQLVYCSVRINGWFDGSQIPSSTVTLKHLHTLRIGVYVAPRLGRILAHLACPQLRSVCFFFDWVSMTEDRDWPEEQILNFVAQSPHIESFEGPTCVVSELCYMQLIRSLPQAITFTVITYEPISNLTLDTIREENLLPNLETFAVRVRSTDAISNFLDSRWSRTPSGLFKGISNINIRINTEGSALETKKIIRLKANLEAAGRVVRLWVV